MNKNDQNLLRQMINAGHFSYDIYLLLVEHNKSIAREKIEQMGEKWCLHPKNAAKRLDTPLPLLNRDSKILKRKKEKEFISFGG